MSPAGTEPRERATWTKPRRGERAGASESIEPARGAILKLPTIWHAAVCPRRESNPHLRFRKPPFYPLNYGDRNQRSEVRCQRSECESSRIYVSSPSSTKRPLCSRRSVGRDYQLLRFYVISPDVGRD